MPTVEELQSEIDKLLKEKIELTKQLDERSPEAIYSITIDKNGGAMVTVRSRPGESGKRFLERLMAMKNEVEKLGFNTKMPMPEQQMQSATPPPANSTPPAQTAESKPVTFPAESLTATVNKGKTYWKVSGGMYKKFGVTIWGEVLAEAGFDVEKLDPTKTYDLNGYTAYVYMSDEGKPQKIWKLTKA